MLAQPRHRVIAVLDFDALGSVAVDASSITNSHAISLQQQLVRDGYRVDRHLDGTYRCVVAVTRTGLGHSSMIHLRAIRQHLERRACVHLLAPASSLTNAWLGLRQAALEPKRVCLVHATPSSDANWCLVSAKRAKRGGLEVYTESLSPDSNPP